MASTTTTLTFSTNQGVATLTFDGHNYHVTNPPTNTIYENTDSITSFGINAFETDTNLVSIVCPTSLITIGSFAFSGCTALTTTTINSPSNLTTIGLHAFNGCTSLTTFGIGTSNLTTIASYAFRLCPLTSFNIPTTVTTIGEHAFDMADLSGGFTFDSPCSLTTFNDETFVSSGITAIQIPNSITTFGTGVFRFCFALSTVTFEATPTMTSLGDETFEHTTISSIIIPDSVTSIGNATFFSTFLTSIHIPDSITTIGNNTFQSCFSLSSITFGLSPTLDTIGDYAFASAGFLNVILPATVMNIGNNAFDIFELEWFENSTPTPMLAPFPNFATDMFSIFFNDPSKTVFTSNSGNWIYSFMQTNYPDVTLVIGPSCYHENTNILTDTGYMPIKNIKVGCNIKTLNDGYKKVIYTHFQPFISNHKSFQTTMYELQTNNEFGNLRITGNHCILLDELQTHMKQVVKENIDEWMIDGKYISVAGYDPKFVKLPEGVYNVYHLVLENDDTDRRYAVFANGLLSETMSEKHYLEEIRGNKK
jgi:hypothetical protein